MITYVYRITNTINGKVYFGKTHDLAARWYKHVWDSFHKYRDYAIQRAIRKYGPSAFRVEVLGDFPNNALACAHERELIAATPKEQCYNIAKGGDGGHTMTPNQLEDQYRIKPDRYDEFTRLYPLMHLLELQQHFQASLNAVRSCARRLGLAVCIKGKRKKRPKHVKPEKPPKVKVPKPPKVRVPKPTPEPKPPKVKVLKSKPEPKPPKIRVPKPKPEPKPRKERVVRVTLTPEERSRKQSELATRINKDRGVSEETQAEIRRLYFDEGLTAKEVAAVLEVTHGSVRATVNRAYTRMTEEEHRNHKHQHGSVVRVGDRNAHAKAFRSEAARRLTKLAIP